MRLLLNIPSVHWLDNLLVVGVEDGRIHRVDILVLHGVDDMAFAE